MLGEIYLVVLCAVGIVTYFHFAPSICIQEDYNDDLDIPIYK
jgi:hypothetical protein